VCQSLAEARACIPAFPTDSPAGGPSLCNPLSEVLSMSTSFRILGPCGLAAAIVLACGFTAEAGFGHRHRHAAACDAAIEPGCSAFAPACAAEPGCAAFEPSCGFEPGCGAETVCPTNPCIKYRHKHAHRHKHGAGCCVEPTYETVLNPVSPETCRAVAVPVCLPACCQGCPCETSRCTLFGCGQVRSARPGFAPAGLLLFVRHVLDLGDASSLRAVVTGTARLGQGVRREAESEGS
jgi:hypothetical protein